jgi:hypothetical protein
MLAPRRVARVKIEAPRFLLLTLLVAVCSVEHREQDYVAGPDGEPPRALEDSWLYTKQFVADQRNYVQVRQLA